MIKQFLLSFYFFYAINLLSGAKWSQERALPEPPRFLSLAQFSEYISVLDSTENETPYTSFTNLLAVLKSGTCQDYIQKLAVCFDFDKTLFEPGRQYTLRSPILPVVISELAQHHVPMSICSRNSEIDEKGRNRLEIAKSTFGDVFNGYYTIDSNQDNTKTSIALAAKGECEIVLLVEDSLSELKNITDPQILKLHFAIHHFRCSLESKNAEQELANQQNSYRYDEEKWVKRIKRELMKN